MKGRGNEVCGLSLLCEVELVTGIYSVGSEATLQPPLVDDSPRPRQGME